jgi:hypothetical protein
MKIKKIIYLIFLFLFIGCGHQYTTKEKLLLDIGQKFINKFGGEMLNNDNSLKSKCLTCNASSYLSIVQDENYKGFELYHFYYTNTDSKVDKIIKYSKYIICITYNQLNHQYEINNNYEKQCCGISMLNEIEWLVLYDTHKNRYIAVESLNMPIELIEQFNNLEWSTKITAATMDSSVNYQIPYGN